MPRKGSLMGRMLVPLQFSHHPGPSPARGGESAQSGSPTPVSGGY